MLKSALFVKKQKTKFSLIEIHQKNQDFVLDVRIAQK